MERAEGIIERCKGIAEDISFAEVHKWKEEHPQGKVVGHFQVYFPEEIAHAGGMLPVKVAGGGNRIEARRASSRLPSFICSICHTSLEMELSVGLLPLDAMIFPPICDAARSLSGIWKRNFPHTLVKILYLPQNLVSQGSLDFLTSEYKRLKDDLAEVAGRPITAADVQKSISVYNENRRRLRQLYAVKRESPWLLSTAEVYSLVRAGTLLPREEHNQMLKIVLEELPQRQARPRDKVRVVLEGGFCEQPPLEFIEVMEEVCYIVDDDLMIGARWLVEDVPEAVDPLRALAASYIEQATYSPVQHEGRRPKEERFLARLKEARAEAVILSAAKFCEPGLDEQVAFAKVLEKMGVPHLVLEFEEKMFSFDQVRTQVETFAESLLFYS